jgi:hypothetical protein
VLKMVRPVAGEETVVAVGPTREAIVSWNALGADGAIELRANALDGRTSEWLPYVAFSADKRASLAGGDGFARIDTDVLRGDVDLVTVGIRSRDPLEAVFVSTPDYGAPSEIVALPALELDVPPFSQYEAAFPSERGWCAPASLAMLLAYRSYPVDVPIVAREVFDSRYGGTGNWTFNAAFAATLGFPSAVVHLRDLAHAHAFLAEDIPVALSLAWEAGDLPGASRRPVRHRRERRRARERSGAAGRACGLSARRLRTCVARPRRDRDRDRTGSLRGSAAATCRLNRTTGFASHNRPIASARARSRARTHRCTSSSSSRRFRRTRATWRACVRRPDARSI